MEEARILSNETTAREELGKLLGFMKGRKNSVANAYAP